MTSDSGSGHRSAQIVSARVGQDLNGGDDAMKRQSFYPFRSERAKAEYEAFCLDRAKAWPLASETMLVDTASEEFDNLENPR